MAKSGMQIRSIPSGIRYRLAMAIALVAWLTAPAPIACSSVCPLCLMIAAMAPATEVGREVDDTLRISGAWEISAGLTDSVQLSLPCLNSYVPLWGATRTSQDG